ncbi:hypothetical protein Mapa_016285 [Marchantia paleacea]|nr:hypothetical protein Mapa_016285 [Marchantia paleacea]
MSIIGRRTTSAQFLSKTRRVKPRIISLKVIAMRSNSILLKGTNTLSLSSVIVTRHSH